MSIGTIDEIRGRLRRAVGHYEDTALVNNDLLDDCIDQAVTKVNQSFPLEGVGSFNTVANQQSYEPLSNTQYAIKKVFWPVGCNYLVPEDYRAYYRAYENTEMVDEYGTRRVFEPSLVVGMQQVVEFYARLYENGAYKLNENKVFLDPVPTKSGDAVYFTLFGQRYSAATDIKPVHEEPFYEYAKHLLHGALSVGRGAVTSVNSPGGVSMNTSAAANHQKAAEECLKRFMSFLPPIKPGRSWQ